MNQPLVSIMIPNFNHSRFLDECFDSVLSQTYTNCEILFLDNQSGDNSLDIAKKYIKYGVKINRNAQNIFNTSFRVLSEQLAQGDYIMLVGADDALEPRCVEKCVSILQAHPSVGYVHVERNFFDENGNITELDPFFRCSFVAPGRAVMPIYMVTTIAHPAQGMIRRSAFGRIEGYQREVDHANTDRSLWFYLSAVSDYAYLREKLCRVRVSSRSETSSTIKNFQHPLLCHMIINEFLRYAQQFGISEVLARKDEALKRLAHECLGYAGKMLQISEYQIAWSYLEYARLLDRSISEDDDWKKLSEMVDTKEIDIEYILSKDTAYSARKRSYEPPEGFTPIVDTSHV